VDPLRARFLDEALGWSTSCSEVLFLFVVMCSTVNLEACARAMELSQLGAAVPRRHRRSDDAGYSPGVLRMQAFPSRIPEFPE